MKEMETRKGQWMKRINQKAEEEVNKTENYSQKKQERVVDKEDKLEDEGRSE